MLSAKELHARYGDVTALDGVSLEANTGTVVGLLGPNGAGKSTTMRILAGAMTPEKGSVSIGREDCETHPEACRALVGYLPENNPLYQEFTVAEHLFISASMKGMDPESAAADIAKNVSDCGLGEVLSRKTRELSKGFRQRVGLAAALLGDPRVLLLDEPTSGLDPNQAMEVRALIRAISPGRAIILSTHLLAEAQACCDRLVIINRGKVAAEGTPEELTGKASSGTVKLRLEAKLQPEALMDKLRNFGEVSVENAGTEILVAVTPPSGGDIRREVAETAAREGWPVLEIAQERQSLEDYFRRLTQ